MCEPLNMSLNRQVLTYTMSAERAAFHKHIPRSERLFGSRTNILISVLYNKREFRFLIKYHQRRLFIYIVM